MARAIAEAGESGEEENNSANNSNPESGIRTFFLKSRTLNLMPI